LPLEPSGRSRAPRAAAPSRAKALFGPRGLPKAK
jgi:hypothetical protein